MNFWHKQNMHAMFTLKDPCTLKSAWTLSKADSQEPIEIPEKVTKNMRNYHLMGVEFLYRNYSKGLQGSILNEEEEMDFPLQVSAFLKAVLRNDNNCVLIICPNSTLSAWHYNLTNHANLKVIKFKSNSKIEKCKENIAVLVEIADIKLCTNLENFDFFAVILENFDSLANKLLIKRLDADFKIGLTTRNFYKRPDQKLLWKMLNWANPGCVGKLHEFYEIDRRNQESFRDNYRPFWLRLTWDFCESFKKPSSESSRAYAEELRDWAEENSLPQAKKAEKRKRAVTESDASSSDTVTYEVPTEDYVKLPSMDENPILTSIIKNFEASSAPEPVRKHSQGTSSKSEDNGVILSFFSDDYERNIKPSTSHADSESFIIDLIKSEGAVERSEDNKIDDIDEFLKQTDSLLQN